MTDIQLPDFESIKQTNIYGFEYWSARDLMPLLGYGSRWDRFINAIRKAQETLDERNTPGYHITRAGKLVEIGSGASRELEDYHMDKYACYIVAQNSDNSKPEVKAAQKYFAISTMVLDQIQLYADQEKRLQLREAISEENQSLTRAAASAGVDSPFFGVFHNEGYKGMYGGLGVREIKLYKGIDEKEELLNRMGHMELSANEFRIIMTEARLTREGVYGQDEAIRTHHEVGEAVRRTIQRSGLPMPEDLPTEPSMKYLLEKRRRMRKKSPKITDETPSLLDQPESEE